jgi:hypothetical protein
MKLTKAIDCPSTLTNREMNCDSEEGSHVIRRSVFTPGDVLHNPIDLEQEIEGSAPLDALNSGLTAPAPSQLGDPSQPRIVIQGGVRGFLTPYGFDYLSTWKDVVNKVMNTAAEALRNATARHMFKGMDQFAAHRSFDDTVLRGEEIDWVQLTESQGNRFRQDLPKYLFLGQVFITKEARGCRHFDLANGCYISSWGWLGLLAAASAAASSRQQPATLNFIF